MTPKKVAAHREKTVAEIERAEVSASLRHFRRYGRPNLLDLDGQILDEGPDDHDGNPRETEETDP